VKAERLAVILCVIECGRAWWPNEEDRFVAYLTDDEPPELACSKCAEREFKD
jgi:hypothetical protein